MQLRDHHREERIFSRRLIWSVVFVLLITLLLLSRMIWLQWLQYDRFSELADQNRIQTQAAPPTRGLILDRNGNLLAQNRPDFAVGLVPEQVPDMNATLAKLQSLLDLEQEDIERVTKELENRRRRPWETLLVRSRMTEEEIAILAAAQHELPGVQLVVDTIRFYPHGELFGHVLGYVNRINTQDLGRMTEQQLENYAGTNFYGRTGIERAYEKKLHGTIGYRQIETNVHGRVLQVLNQQHAQPGLDLQLHLDLEVQQIAWDALGDRRGAVVAIDPRNGGVLAMVSRPAYDPNLFVTGISNVDYANYRDNYDRPLFNRAIQGQYPPGSTIKPHHGLAGIESGATTWARKVADPGIFQLPNTERVYRDWKKGGHAERINLHDSVVQSCDVYFYDMGVRTGIDFLHEFMSAFSFGRKTGIDIPNEAEAIMPSRDWKRGAKGSQWFDGDTVNVSIGQGYFLATPLQLAHSMVIMARKGKQILPRIANLNTATPTTPDITLKQERNWDKMTQAMIDVVHGQKGTARMSGLRAKYKIAGKTGTAQVFSVPQDEEYNAEELEERLKDHALFVAYAPAKDPAIAIAVMIENGEHGSSAAAPVARAVMDAWLLNDEGEFEVPAPLETP